MVLVFLLLLLATALYGDPVMSCQNCVESTTCGTVLVPHKRMEHVLHMNTVREELRLLSSTGGAIKQILSSCFTQSYHCPAMNFNNPSNSWEYIFHGLSHNFHAGMNTRNRSRGRPFLSQILISWLNLYIIHFPSDPISLIPFIPKRKSNLKFKVTQ